MNLRLEDKLYWSRFLGGIIMGFLTEFFKLYKPTILLGIFVAALAYIISVIILSDHAVECEREVGKEAVYLRGRHICRNVVNNVNSMLQYS